MIVLRIRPNHATRHNCIIFCIIALWITGTTFLDFATPVGIVGGVLYTGPIYLSGWLSHSGSMKRWSVLSMGTLCTALTILGYWLSSEGGIRWMAISNHAIALAAIWMSAVLALVHIRIIAENAELRELLPICSYCKQIRDDEGAWHRLETYLHRHAGVEFTHGMCPPCLRTYLHELARDPADVIVVPKS